MLQSDSLDDGRAVQSEFQVYGETRDESAMERIDWLSSTVALSVPLTLPPASRRVSGEPAPRTNRSAPQEAVRDQVTLAAMPPPAVQQRFAPSESPLSPFFAAANRARMSGLRGIDLLPLPGGMLTGLPRRYKLSQGADQWHPAPETQSQRYSSDASGRRGYSQPSYPRQEQGQYYGPPEAYSQPRYSQQPDLRYRAPEPEQYRNSQGDVLGPRWQPKMKNYRSFDDPLDFKIELPKPRNDPNYLRDTFGLKR